MKIMNKIIEDISVNDDVNTSDMDIFELSNEFCDVVINEYGEHNFKHALEIVNRRLKTNMEL